MAIEIERKFLVRSDAWRSSVVRAKHLQQAYLSKDGGFSARVRIVDGRAATLTIKSSRAGPKRLEFEYPVPIADAEQLMALGQGAAIEKVRHIVRSNGLTWEIDVFGGANAGLVVAEVELENETQAITLPDWVGAEVTRDARYYNSNLVMAPFSTWHDAEVDSDRL